MMYIQRYYSLGGEVEGAGEGVSTIASFHVLSIIV